ncbi:MAG: hypothetical protein IJT51_00935 [Bacteroidales bacterium]|nr:hypothetical protein [Bacteroidales bacterium]
MMKKRNLLALMLGFGIFVQGLDVFSQNSTQCINYQAVVRDSTNRLVATKTIDILITLMDTSGTNEYYQEIHRTTTNTQGLVTLKIGCGTAIKGDFFSIRWDISQMRAEYDIDTNGVYDLLSIETISAVPYALYSANAENLQNNFDSIVQNINMSIADISNHLTISGLCDSVSNCEIIRTLQDSVRMFLTSDSIQILVRDSIADFLTSDSIQRLVQDSLSHYLTIAGLCDSVSNCEIIKTLQDSVRMFLTSDSIQILVRDSIAEFLTSDSIQQLVKDSLSNYLTISGLCDSVSNCVIIRMLQDGARMFLTSDSIQILVRDSISDFLTSDSIHRLVNDSLKNYLTIAGLCDSVSNCEIIRTLQDSARMFLTSDSIQILVRDSIADFLTSDSIQRLVKDSLSNYLTIAGLCDSVSNCEIIRTLQDSARMFLTSDSIQMLVRDSIAEFLTSDSIQRLVKDSLSNYLTIAGLCDSVSNCEIIRTLQDSARMFLTSDSIQHLVKDSLSNYLKLYELCSKIGECGIITELQNSVQDNASALIRDSINLKETITFLDDTIRMLFDSLHALQDSLNQLKQNMINGEETISFVVGDDYEEYSLGNHNEPKTAAEIKVYVNGARICCAAWSYDQQNRSFVYDPTKNDNYELMIGDNIIIEYLY